MGQGCWPRVRLVDALPGSAKARARLRVILDNLAGERTVAAAIRVLGISRRHFHALRLACLRAALHALEPRPIGRPAQQPGDCDRLTALEAELQNARIDLRAAQVREEIALTMPHLLRRTQGRKRETRRRRSSPARKPAT